MSDAYCIVSARSKGFVSTTQARVARMDEPMRPVHLVLQPAVHVHGRLTWGKDHQPDANDAVTLVERDEDRYSKLPEEERLPRTLPLAELAHVAIDIPHNATTDAQGRFDFEVAPGRYVIGAGGFILPVELRASDNAQRRRRPVRRSDARNSRSRTRRRSRSIRSERIFLYVGRVTREAAGRAAARSHSRK